MNLANILDWALGNSKIEVHENGFLILRLPDGGSRLHLHHESVPRQKVSTPIHTHRWPMNAIVLAGRLRNELFLVKPDFHPATPPHVAYEVVDGRQVRAGVMDRCVYPRRIHLDVVEAPGVYTVPAGIFHTTTPEPVAVTLMMRGAATEKTAQVLVPVGKEPDNDFHRFGFHQQRMRDLAYAIVREARDYHLPD